MLNQQTTHTISGADAQKVLVLFMGNIPTREELLDSVIRNWVEVAKGNIDHEQAIRNVTRESGEKVSTHTASYIKSKMSSSGNSFLRSIAETDLVDTLTGNSVAAVTGELKAEEAIANVGRAVGQHTSKQATAYAKDKLSKSGNPHLQTLAKSEMMDSLADSACALCSGDITADEALSSVGKTVERETLRHTVSFAKGKMTGSSNASLRSLGESDIPDTAIMSGYAYLKGDIDGDQALKDVVDASVVHYTKKGIAVLTKNTPSVAKQPLAKAIAKSNLPAMVAEVAVNLKDTFGRYLRGEISGVECFEELGQHGADTICSAVGSLLGQVAIPIPGIGAIAGSMLGYALSSASYGALRNDLQQARLARERRVRIHAQCEARIRMMRQFRAQFEMYNERYLKTREIIFTEAVNRIDLALELNDTDSLLAATSAISSTLGNKTRPANMQEVRAIMNSDAPFRL